MANAERSRTTVLRFGDFEVDLPAGLLLRHGIRVRLRDKSLLVLGALLERRGQVVTREELQRRLWPADVFVDVENNLNTAIARLREALGDSADHPRFIETLPKHGYRFIGALSVRHTVDAIGPEGHVRSIAVVPFANPGVDPEVEVLADGITDDLLVALSHVPGLRVPGRTSCLAFRGASEDLRRIGRTLGVDVVVEGSVRRDGSRLRVTARAIDVADGLHLWSERYEHELTGVFGAQDAIAQAIAAGLVPALNVSRG